MKKKVTFKAMLVGAGRGIKNVILWIGRVLGFKKEMDGEKAIKHGILLCVLVAALTLAGACIKVTYQFVQTMIARYEYKQQEHQPDYYPRKLSNDVIFHNCLRHGKSYVYNKVTGQKTLEDIVWVATPADDENLVCFFDGKKRGYFDRNTGEVVIPAQYERAWIFSDSVAAVLINGRLSFINHQGKKMMDKTFYYNSEVDGYCFHNGSCPVYTDEKHVGLIDKQGNWLVKPVYTAFYQMDNGYWDLVAENEMHGVVSNKGEMVLPCVYRDIAYVRDTEEYYKVLTWNHVNQVLDMNGKVVNSCDYYGIEKMTYTTDELVTQVDEYEEYTSTYKEAVANCLQYCTSDNHYGLMDKKGNAITAPLYSSIRPIAADRYMCESEYGCIILDDNGKECGEKP